MNNTKTDHTNCAFVAKRTGNDTFFITIEPNTGNENLPEKCLLGLNLINPNSFEEAKRVQEFLNEHLSGFSVTLTS